MGSCGAVCGIAAKTVKRLHRMLDVAEMNIIHQCLKFQIQRISVESREQPVVFLFAKTRVRICA